MAEIKIEKKKPLWPWILLLIILAIAVILYFMNENGDEVLYDDDQIEDVDDTDDIDAIDDTGELGQDNDTITYGQAFSRQESDRIMMDYRSSIYDSIKIGTDAKHTKLTMAKLIEAVEIKSRQFNVEASNVLDGLKNEGSIDDSEANTKNMELTTEQVKNQAASIAEVLDKIQNKQFPAMDNDIMELEMTINSIDTRIELKDQRRVLNSFFNKAADLLNNMN